MNKCDNKGGTSDVSNKRKCILDRFDCRDGQVVSENNSIDEIFFNVFIVQ
jgi:hypothetical protein